ncbi:hypothetical protein FYJ27_12135 [Anaerosalibacter bizertensis]|uniref:Uncharacterized protein n=1 Tax=Anaerosalibacter bizertensis TaxID=932217 RepID=A0A844FKH1_9FIRM|nr:hypothetical protein [Anaerosalibacter bizertensis]MSS44422.1 hypothetical protein [Anaerosalibacter bizertensis]
MSELVIETHDFEVAKKGLEEFSKKKAEELELDTVRTDGGFLGLGDHKVTGYELNCRLSAIQQHLIDLNNTNNKTIKEFGQVYNALEALDKDYIQAILISIKATEETSKRIEATQEQIKKIVDDQKKTLEVLKKFKQRLDNYVHLGDIDEMWNDCQKWYKDITTLSNSINNAISIGNATAKKIESLKAALKTTDEKMDDLSKYKERLCGIAHLNDVDELWDSNEVHSNQLSELEKQGEETKKLIQNNKKLIDVSIADAVEKNNTAIQMLTQKTKYAYMLAGGSLGFALIELIFILLKVI